MTMGIPQEVKAIEALIFLSAISEFNFCFFLLDWMFHCMMCFACFVGSLLESVGFFERKIITKIITKCVISLPIVITKSLSLSRIKTWIAGTAGWKLLCTRSDRCSVPSVPSAVAVVCQTRLMPGLWVESLLNKICVSKKNLWNGRCVSEKFGSLSPVLTGVSPSQDGSFLRMGRIAYSWGAACKCTPLCWWGWLSR
jgi:hypothetical protein